MKLENTFIPSIFSELRSVLALGLIYPCSYINIIVLFTSYLNVLKWGVC